MTFRTILAAVALLLSSLGGSAVRADGSLLQPGAFYDRAAPGSGILFDVGREGTVFGTFFVYDENRQPTFYTFSNRLVPATGETLESGGPIATLEAPLYRSTGGQCLGCPWTPPASAPDSRAGHVAIRVLTPRSVEVEVGRNTWHMTAMELDVAAKALAAGRWHVRIRRDVGAFNQPLEVDSIVRVREIPTAEYRLTRETFDTRDRGFPPAGSSQYEVVCEERCESFDAWRRASTENGMARDNRVVWWIDSATLRSGWDLYVDDVGGRAVDISRRRFDINLADRFMRGYERRYAFAVGNFIAGPRLGPATLELSRLGD